MIRNIIKFLKEHKIEYEQNVDLKKKTWIHRGGLAFLYVLPSNVGQLTEITKYLYVNKIDFLLVGHTSNLYILNSRDIEIVVTTLKCKKYEVTNNHIYCEAGVGVIKLSNAMIQLGFKGFEYLTELPGTIGAAICNNSSCKCNSIAKLLVSADVLTPNGDVITMNPENFEFQFRTSVFKQHKTRGVILSAILKAEIGCVSQLKEISLRNEQERTILLEGHAKNLGCTVNRPWSLGNMPLIYRLYQSTLKVLLMLFCIDDQKRKKILKQQLFSITGYSDVEPYVSDKNPIVFMWLDDGADKVFDRYLIFMKKIFKTNSIEIQILR